jgi:site-specific recombinase XerD
MVRNPLPTSFSNGCDLVTVRDRLGHSDVKVTSRYLHVLPGEHDRALDALSAALAA